MDFTNVKDKAKKGYHSVSLSGNFAHGERDLGNYSQKSYKQSQEESNAANIDYYFKGHSLEENIETLGELLMKFYLGQSDDDGLNWLFKVEQIKLISALASYLKNGYPSDSISKAIQESDQSGIVKNALQLQLLDKQVFETDFPSHH